MNLNPKKYKITFTRYPTSVAQVVRYSIRKLVVQRVKSTEAFLDHKIGGLMKYRVMKNTLTYLRSNYRTLQIPITKWDEEDIVKGIIRFSINMNKDGADLDYRELARLCNIISIKRRLMIAAIPKFYTDPNRYKLFKQIVK